MNILLTISDYIIPIIIFYIVSLALLSKVNAYEEFITGVKDGLKTVLDILPTLIGLMLGIGIIRASGLLEQLGNFLGKYSETIGVPGVTIPLFIVKMFSSSAATGLLLDIYKEFGTDSIAGFICSLALSSTETIFYTMSVCFLAAGVKKTRWTLAGALLCTFAGIAASVFISHMILGGI